MDSIHLTRSEHMATESNTADHNKLLSDAWDFAKTHPVESVAGGMIAIAGICGASAVVRGVGKLTEKAIDRLERYASGAGDALMEAQGDLGAHLHPDLLSKQAINPEDFSRAGLSEAKFELKPTVQESGKTFAESSLQISQLETTRELKANESLAASSGIQSSMLGHDSIFTNFLRENSRPFSDHEINTIVFDLLESPQGKRVLKEFGESPLMREQIARRKGEALAAGEPFNVWGNPRQLDEASAALQELLKKDLGENFAHDIQAQSWRGDDRPLGELLKSLRETRS